MADQRTLDYYNRNAQAFIADTKAADMSAILDRFLSLLPAGARILDLGCGSGRDTRSMIERGYRAEGVDGSTRMVLACRQAGLPVRRMRFEELNENERYAGIWACASLLHARSDELPAIFRSISQALQEDGIFYCSFKYGTFEGMRNGRYFTDLYEEKLAGLLEQAGLERISMWQSRDVRADRKETIWLNVISRKARADGGGKE